MSDSKFFMFPDNYGNKGCQSSIDPNLLLALNNGGGFGNGGNWIWILFLYLLWGNNGWGNGFGGNGFGSNVLGTGYLSNQINNDTGREILMQAIQGNANAIQQLSNMFGCKVDSIQNTICNLTSQIQGIGGQMGMGFQQTINAVQAGNTQLGMQIAQCCCDLRTQLAQCCCDVKESVANVNNTVTRGFADVGYAFRDQTCNIEKAIASSTESILAGQRAAEMREMQDKIDALREKNSQQATIINNAQQTQVVGQMITQATQPIYQAVGALQSDVDKIKCKLPETVTLPYSCATAVPTQAVLNYANLGLGVWGGNGCCGNSLWG